MSAELNWDAIGLKCGLEIHQRLATQRKLFCNCSAVMSAAKPRGEIFRSLVAVPSELGQFDPAALFEISRGRGYRYQLFDNTCLVEVDEQPPLAIDGEALKIALSIALTLGAKPVHEIHVMRKTVVDGSAVSGFQRTALIATNGALRTSIGDVKIPTICLEEESAGIVAKSEREVIYRLDRQGIPLIEIATSEELRSPEHVHEAAQAIGQLLRMSGFVQRGIGSIRQDVNISIARGARVEIKGAQELRAIKHLVENEARRQLALLDIAQTLSERSASCALKSLDGCEAIVLRNWRELLDSAIMPGWSLFDELASYAEAHGARALRASDEQRAQLLLSPSDEALIVFGEELRRRHVAHALLERTQLAMRSIPRETRRADGEKSVFMRPLPGPARMYPETDLMPIVVDEALLGQARAAIAKSAQQRTQEWRALGLGDEMIKKLLKSRYIEWFERLLATGAAPTLIASTLIETLRALSREGLNTNKLQLEELRELFNRRARGEIARAAIEEVLRDALKQGITLQQAAKNYPKMPPREIEAGVEKLFEKGLSEKQVVAALMSRHRLCLDSEDIHAAITKLKRRKGE